VETGSNRSVSSPRGHRRLLQAQLVVGENDGHDVHVVWWLDQGIKPMLRDDRNEVGWGFVVPNGVPLSEGRRLLGKSGYAELLSRVVRRTRNAGVCVAGVSQIASWSLARSAAELHWPSSGACPFERTSSQGQPYLRMIGSN
jgi:hypothetical protein